jgi:DNA-binding transcriptional ArsR family regulator
MSAEQPIRGDADIAPMGALIGDPTRARVLMALTDGRALPASRLAAEAGVAPSTVSEHLARLLAAGLVTMHPEGRSRFYRLPSAEVAEALEALARISPDQPIRSLRQGSHARALREARTCYNHLAGRLGARHRAGRPAVRPRLGSPHPAAPRGPGHRPGAGEAARGARAARRLG